MHRLAPVALSIGKGMTVGATHHHRLDVTDSCTTRLALCIVSCDTCSQEMLDKAPQLPKDIQWHFIGHLQSNKVKSVIGQCQSNHWSAPCSQQAVAICTYADSSTVWSPSISALQAVSHLDHSTRAHYVHIVRF